MSELSSFDDRSECKNQICDFGSLGENEHSEKEGLELTPSKFNESHEIISETPSEIESEYVLIDFSNESTCSTNITTSEEKFCDEGDDQRPNSFCEKEMILREAIASSHINVTEIEKKTLINKIVSKFFKSRKPHFSSKEGFKDAEDALCKYVERIYCSKTEEYNEGKLNDKKRFSPIQVLRKASKALFNSGNSDNITSMSSGEPINVIKQGKTTNKMENITSDDDDVKNLKSKDDAQVQTDCYITKEIFKYRTEKIRNLETSLNFLDASEQIQNVNTYNISSRHNAFIDPVCEFSSHQRFWNIRNHRMYCKICSCKSPNEKNKKNVDSTAAKDTGAWLKPSELSVSFSESDVSKMGKKYNSSSNRYATVRPVNRGNSYDGHGIPSTPHEKWLDRTLDRFPKTKFSN